MTNSRIALLPDRGVVKVMGEDAGKLLQGVITNDIALLQSQPAIHAGLLTPQGKILFDFFVVRVPGGFCLEAARDKTAELSDRLNLYKLRVKAEIEDASANHTVAALWGGPYELRHDGKPPIWFADPRLPGIGFRELVTMRTDWALGGEDADTATQDDYHTHRIELGVPEGGKDYAFGATFPHEALFDQLHGVSFEKGCYIGQEVVSRMANRGTARKRLVPVVGAAELPAPGTEIIACGVTIGSLGSTAATRGLALLRLDRAAEMSSRGLSLYAGEVPVRIQLRSWAHFGVSAKELSTPI
jgi:folate-binding protein YgfZ